MKKSISPLLAAAALLALSAALAFSIERLRSAEHTASIFFSGALQSAGVSETVVVLGKHYGVSGGTVTAENGGAVSSEERLRALETAYALTLARRSPILGIAGTDPAYLRSGAEKLASAERELARTQKTPDDAFMTDSVLYPIGFLQALAALEERRLRFLSSGSDVDAAGYAATLADAVHAGARDAASFSAAFAVAAGDQKFKLSGFNGTITAQNMHRALAEIGAGMDRARQEAQDRASCLSGTLQRCDRTDLAPRATPLPQTTTDQGIPTLVNEVRAIISQSRGGVSKRPPSFVALEESACLQTLPGPHYFMTFAPLGSGGRTFAISYRNDLFFRSTSNQGPVNQYQRSVLGITYSLVNPVTFYACPEVERDIGAVYAATAIAAFAQKHPSLAPEARAQLLREPRLIRQSDAQFYLRRAQIELRLRPIPYAPKTAHELEELALMEEERSAKLGLLASDIAGILETDLRLKAAGAPFDLGARNLFLTHSAFPSLFLLQNPSAGTGGRSLAQPEAQDAAAFFSTIETYGQVRASLSQNEVAANVRSFLMMEGRIARPLTKPLGCSAASPSACLAEIGDFFSHDSR